MKQLYIALAFSTSLFASEYSYVQLNSHNEFELRYIGNNPNAYCDDKKIEFTQRYSNDYNVWFANVNNCKQVVANSKNINLTRDIQTVAVVGDSGCRIKINKNGQGKIQNCEDENAWPAKAVAESIGMHKPDLIVHVGDYNYREYCLDTEICKAFDIKKSDVGYNFNIWQKDFFEPYNSILMSAPFVFARGNHEGCSRGWQVYKSTLSPYEYTECTNNDTASDVLTNQTEKPYTLHFNNLNLVIADTSSNTDEQFNEVNFKYYKSNFKSQQINNSLFISHIPIYSFERDNQNSILKALQAIGAKPKAVLSGDIHVLEYINMPEHTQIISAGGGDMLEGVQGKAPSIDSKQITNFGFLILAKKDNGFHGIFYSKDNEKLYEFDLK